jgi:hypothetical protein
MCCTCRLGILKTLRSLSVDLLLSVYRHLPGHLHSLEVICFALLRVVDGEPLVAATADLQLMLVAGIPGSRGHLRKVLRLLPACHEVTHSLHCGRSRLHDLFGDHSGGDHNEGSNRQHSISQDVRVVAPCVVDLGDDGEMGGAGVAVEGLAGPDVVMVEDPHLPQLDGEREVRPVPEDTRENLVTSKTIGAVTPKIR